MVHYRRVDGDRDDEDDDSGYCISPFVQSGRDEHVAYVRDKARTGPASARSLA
jgi:hypothetical protein